MEHFKKSLSKDLPLNEYTPTWGGYRLRNSRMARIREHSAFILFTCDYEKHYDIRKSDFVKVQYKGIQSQSNEPEVDILYLEGTAKVSKFHGKIGKTDLRNCEITFNQSSTSTLHVHINPDFNNCNFKPITCHKYNRYFGDYDGSTCFDKTHSCVQNENSTTQLWFGSRMPESN